MYIYNTSTQARRNTLNSEYEHPARYPSHIQTNGLYTSNVLFTARDALSPLTPYSSTSHWGNSSDSSGGFPGSPTRSFSGGAPYSPGWLSPTSQSSFQSSTYPETNYVGSSAGLHPAYHQQWPPELQNFAEGSSNTGMGFLPPTSPPMNSTCSDFPVQPWGDAVPPSNFPQMFGPPIVGQIPSELKGLFVPQLPYERKQNVNYVLHPPIFFRNDSPRGLFVQDAVGGRCGNLRNSTQVVFEGMGQSVSIRINWPGYRSWSKQTSTYDFKKVRTHLPLQQAAVAVSRMIKYFFQEVNDGRVLPDPHYGPGEWEIGPHNICLEHVVLDSINHVTRGSWQPVLVVWKP